MDTIILSVLSGVFAYGVVFLIAERARKRRKANKDQLTEDIKNLTAERARLYRSIEELGRQQTEAELNLQDTIDINMVCGKDSIEEVRDEVEEAIKKAVRYWYNKTSFKISAIHPKWDNCNHVWGASLSISDS